MIDQATIDRILEAAEIAEVVSEYVTLKKRGVNMLGLCPFHNEKTPSFTVSPAKGIFKCFGCGKGGNAVNFIMEHDSLTYPEALRWLARKYNIDIREEEETPEHKQLKNERESLMVVSAFAGNYFSRMLWESEEGRSEGLSYFRERGLRDTTIRTFELGYCPNGRDIFTQEALKNGYKLEYLEKTGLTTIHDDWKRDRFAGRVIFPIHNLAGRVTGFGGRTLKADKNIAKYLNSPESEIYHKSSILYGLTQARREIVRLDRCYLVEGYTDVLSLHQSGIENVAASSGTALTPDQIRLIKRFTANITIIYDGDTAGIKASLRGIDLILEEGMNVKVLPLPNGEDPDTFAQSMSATQLHDYIAANETDFIKFKTQLLLQQAQNDPVERARLINDIVRSIAVVPDTITRSVYIQECSRLLNVGEEILYQEVRKIKFRQTDEALRRTVREQQRTTHRQDNQTHTPVENNFKNEEKELIRLMLKYFHHEIFEVENEETNKRENVTVGNFILQEIENDGLHSENEIVNDILSIFSANMGDLSFIPSQFFVNHNNPLISALSVDLLADKYTESKRWSKNGGFTEKEEDILDLLVPRIVQEYKLKKIKKILRELEADIDLAIKSNDMTLVMEYQNRYISIKKVERYLSEQLGNRTII